MAHLNPGRISIQSLSHLHLCTVSLPSRYQDSCLTSTQFLIYVPHLHLGNVSPPSKSRASQLHHGPISPYPGLKMCISSQSRSDLTPIQVWRFASQLHPCSVPPPSRSLDSQITYIQVAFISIQVQMFASHIHPGDVLHLSWNRKYCISAPSHVHPGFKLCVTPPSRSCLTCIQAPIVLSHPHPCTVSPPSRSEIMHLTCIHITSYLHSSHKRDPPCSGRNWFYCNFFFKTYHKFIEFNLFFIHLILFRIGELIHVYSIYMSSMNIELHLSYENRRQHF